MTLFIIITNRTFFHSDVWNTIGHFNLLGLHSYVTGLMCADQAPCVMLAFQCSVEPL